MATPGWRSGHPLREQVLAQHAGFDYYQLVSLLLRDQSRASGRRASFERDLRVRADLSAAFPGHEVTGVEPRRDGTVTLSSANYSVASALGPLPEPYTEWARERAGQGDRAMVDFLDLFNVRLHALRFAIKAQHRPGLGGEPPEQTVLGTQLAAFQGVPDGDGAPRLPLPRRALLALAGLLSDGRRSAAAIGSVLQTWLDAPVAIEQMVGAWRAIEPEEQTRLKTRNSRLGVGTVLGTRVWDQQARIAITLGPLPTDRFRQLLPGGAGHEELVRLIRYLLDGAADAEVVLHTEADAWRIGGESAPLGRRSWLGAAGHAGEVRFVVHAFAPREAAA